MSNSIISIKDLNFGYGNHLLHKGIDMEFPRGKVSAIMGGSGSGKTTILRLIGGQIKPNSGQVEVDGTIVHKQNRDGIYRLRRKMGMLFQHGALFSDLSVFENVAFPMREHTDLPENIIKDLVLLKLNAVGLRGAAYLMPPELSGGMARRVALARAIALDPDIIMYDEPFAGLDPISMAVICDLIRSLNDADYIYFVADGVVAAEGSPKQLMASKLPFVKQFIHAEKDGPVPFHYNAPSIKEDLDL